MSMLSSALQYAEQGWPVFPCEVGGKRPLTPHGFKDATTSAILIEYWWSAACNPGANIGLAVPERLLIVDVDPRNGGPASPADIDLPRTQQTDTPGGGYHLYFTVPEGLSFRSTLGPGIDVKAPGKGYVLLPPSWVWPTAYRWRQEGRRAELSGATLASMVRPDFEVSAASSGTKRYFPWERGTRYGVGVLRNAVEAIENAENGSRNNTLFKATANVASYIAGGELSEDVLHDVRQAALDSGLSDAEVHATMMSAYESGQQNPRRKA